MCLYSQRDKATDKVWPKGTAETMQLHTNTIEEALIAAYSILRDHDLWPGGLVETCVEDGRPSIHQIAEGLGVDIDEETLKGRSGWCSIQGMSCESGYWQGEKC